jgi:biopolymer transport protein ExbD
MKLNRKKPKDDAGIDMSPLIDMVFILLIFFMVSTTFTKDMKLDLERPNAASSTAASDKSIKVYIDEHSDIYIDGEGIRVWVLQGKVRDLLRSGKSKSILVVTDKKVLSERLIEVVDQIKLAGAKEVSVATSAEVGV